MVLLFFLWYDFIMKLTHNPLCDLAGRYLRGRGYEKVLVQTGYRKENPDAFAIDKYGSILIECKATRSDFLADKKKPFRINPEQGIGQCRYYLVNEGVIKSEEDIPNGWQVLIAKDENTIEAYTNHYFGGTSWISKEFKFAKRNFEAELELLWSWFYRKEHDCLPDLDNKPTVEFVYYKFVKEGA